MASVLVVAPAWVGDMVMAQSLVAALKRRAPDDAIDLLAPSYTAALGARMPGVRDTIPIGTAHGRFDLFERLTAGRGLRGKGYELAIVLPGSFKSAIVPFAARIPRRRGYVGEWRYGLLNDARRLDAKRLRRTVDRFVALAAGPGDPVPVAAAADARARRRPGPHALRRNSASAGGRPVIALCPGAEYGPAKQWPAAHFAALADRLADAGYATWIFGSPKEAPWARPSRRSPRRATGPPPRSISPAAPRLLEAIDLLSLAAAVATNDSGLMHIAAALGRPLVALYGSTTPEMTPPLGDPSRSSSGPFPAAPAFSAPAPSATSTASISFTAAEVADALLSLAAANQAA